MSARGTMTATAKDLLDAAATALELADDTLGEAMSGLAEARAHLRSSHQRLLEIVKRFARLDNDATVDEPAAARIMSELRQIQQMEADLTSRIASLEGSAERADTVGIREAARLCGVSFSTFNEWVIAGKVPHEMPKGVRVFRRSDLEALTEAS